jgi:hypothetical protein
MVLIASVTTNRPARHSGDNHDYHPLTDHNPVMLRRWLGSLALHHSFLSFKPVIRLLYVDEFPSLLAFLVQPRMQIFGLA